MLHHKHHLTYCTNIHAGESWQDIKESLKDYLPSIKKDLELGTPLGIGLRLSGEAGKDLADPAQLQEFKDWLNSENLYVFTMNGFPYGGFHHQVVKDDVHKPDWATPERLRYTLQLFDILAELLPNGMDGGISTSPLSYKYWHKTDAETQKAFDESNKNILKVVAYLYEIEQKTGKILHLDIEPEPDGLIENTPEVIDYFNNWLLPKGIPDLKKELGIRDAQAEAAIRKHIQLCYDVCHYAVGYEEPSEVFVKMKEEGIGIGKIQISAALKAQLPENPADRKEIEKEFSPFVESTYLHQVVALTKDKTLLHYNDLPPALADIGNPEVTEWRTHFHVPVFLEKYSKLYSTQEDIKKVLEYIKLKEVTNHLEVETYTWEVLPKDIRLDLKDSIVRELKWVKEILNK